MSDCSILEPESDNVLSGKFWKLHACGNSAVMMTSKATLPTPEQVRRMILTGPSASRADNLLMFTTDGCSKGIDILVEGFNADGSRVGLCGNGARCLVWMAVKLGDLPLRSAPYDMLMDNTRLSIQIESFEDQTVSMLVQPPSFDPDSIPFTGESSSGRLKILDEQYEYVVVDVGNPHCVLFVPELLSPESLTAVAQHLQKDVTLFPEGVNVSACTIDTGSRIHARIYERGVGLSSSSGTGSVAIASAARSFKGLGEKIEVCMDGGTQVVEWKGGGTPVRATTQVTFVGEGEFGRKLAH